MSPERQTPRKISVDSDEIEETCQYYDGRIVRDKEGRYVWRRYKKPCGFPAIGGVLLPGDALTPVCASHFIALTEDLYPIEIEELLRDNSRPEPTD